MNHINNKQLEKLPRVFQSTNEQIDHNLFKTICTALPIPKLSKRIRALLQICGFKLKPNDDPFYQLGAKFPNIDFRYQWYHHSTQQKSNTQSIEGFYTIVNRWCIRNHPTFNWKSPELNQFFESRKDKIFPRLERIDILSDQLTNIATHSLIDSALYAWALFESAKWHSFSQPNETSLTNLRSTLLINLKDRKANDLLDLLEDGVFSSEVESQETEIDHVDGKVIFNQSSHPQKSKNYAIEQESITKINNLYQEKINHLSNLITEAKNENNNSTKIIKNILYSNNPTRDIETVTESMKRIHQLIHNLDSCATSTEEGIAEITLNAIQRTSINLNITKLPIFSFATSNQWKENLTAHKDLIENVLRCIFTLKNFDAELIQIAAPDYFNKTISLEDAIEQITIIKNKTSIFHNGLNAKQVLLEALKEKQDDFSWNPIFETSISSECWINFGEYLAEQKSMPEILGLCTRKHYKQLHTKVSELIDKESTNNNIKIDEIFKILTSMTLGQIEGLKCNTNDGKIILAIAELQFFLQIVDIEPTKAYAFWSAKPLSEYIKEQSSNASERFFSAAFKASSQEGGNILNISELHHLATFASSKSQSNPNKLQEVLKHNLLEILKFHPGGGQIYAQLWDLAFNVICTPLIENADKGELDAVAEIYSKFRVNFEIDNHLRTWRSTLPERLRKRSEYEKKLRLMVKGKLDELDAWLNFYESTKNNSTRMVENTSLNLLETAITDILFGEYPDCNVLQKWLQNLANAPINRSVNTISLASTIEPLFIESVKISSDAFHPRAFLATINGDSATIADLLADKLFVNFGLYTAEKLAKVYADKKYYEAFSALSIVAPNSIPVDVERQVEVATDELEKKYLSQINEIEMKVTIIDKQNAEIIVSSLVEIKSWLNDQQWMKARLELLEVERTINGIIQKLEEDKKLQALLVEIQALGGQVPIITNRSTIEEAYKKITSETEPRREHLNCLRNVLTVEELNIEIRIEFSETLSALALPEKLPKADRSSEVAYIFSETVGVLANELRRSKTSLPSYNKKLNLLALAVAKELKLYGVNEKSPIISLLIESHSDWQGVAKSEDGAIERLLTKLSIKDIIDSTASDPSIIPEIIINPIPTPTEINDIGDTQDPRGVISAYIDRLILAIPRISNEIKEKNIVIYATDNDKNLGNKFLETSTQARTLFEKCEDKRSSLALGHLTDWAVSILKGHQEMLSAEEHAAALHLINKYQKSASVSALLPSKSFKGQLGDVVTRFLNRIAKDCGLAASTNAIEQIIYLSDNVDQLKKVQSVFFVCFSPIGKNDSLVVKNLWDLYSGENRQAEARAALMNILWQTSATAALACCLKYAPIDIDSRTAEALANIADQALSQGRVDLLQSFVDLRRTINAKPFQLFVGLLLSKNPTKSDPPAQISFTGPLEHTNEQGKLAGILRIKPRRSDSPDIITLRLPQNTPILFDTGTQSKVLKGPFIDDETLLPISFLLRDQDAYNFTILINCEASSITKITSTFEIRLEFLIFGIDLKSKISTEEIAEAFQHFPHAQMRQEDYVHRPDDERRIENDLFKSKTVRSLWISSPRRSGKTTMLYRILDAYSHKVGRDNLVAYFSLNKSFDSTTIFNDWLWKGLKNSIDNSELRSLFTNFPALGRDLPSDADIGTFIEYIVDRLVASATVPVARTIFLFDEIDKLATMYFEGGKRKDTAIEIAWQLRQLIGRRRDIGFVFAGSSAAKKIFLTNHDSPFFNAGILFELSPFACTDIAKETSAREIIEPPRIKGRLTIPKATLAHLVWVCSGIPYYMKLLAGATYAVTKQAHVLMSDVDEGLHALLQKRTGISHLDGVEGDPGSDELWTIALEKGADRLLTQGALYAAAELESPLSGYPIRRASFYGESSPLISRYQLPRQAVERGLDRAIELGLFKLTGDRPPKICFAIPILGESIRHGCGGYWAEIDHQLEQLSIELRTTK